MTHAAAETTTTRGDLNARRDDTVGTMNLNWRLAGERECDVRAAAALASDINTTRECRRRRSYDRLVGISSGPTLCARPPARYTSATPPPSYER